MRLEGRTAAEAMRSAVQPSQRVLSCVSQAVLATHETSPGKRAITTGRLAEALTSGGYRVAVFEEYRAESAPPRVVLARIGYRYRVLSADRELLAYHWNPEGLEGKPYPHLHLSAAAEVGNRALTRAHIPTGEVTLADVARLLIEELGVRPRRADWRAVLDETVG